MDTLFGLEVVDDDSLHGRAVAEGMGLEDEGDLFCWLAEQARETGSCALRLRTPRLVLSRPPRGPILHGRSRPAELDTATGRPARPERRRLEREARAWGLRHTWAQAWL